MQKFLKMLYQGKTLKQKQIKKFLDSIVNQKLSPIQIASALISMKVRGETFEEIIGTANILLMRYAKPFPYLNETFADITGTGGDAQNTINISTLSAIVAAACNVKIIKYGNYSSSSLIGSMNLIQDNINNYQHDAYQVIKNFYKSNICFICAAHYYKIFHNVMLIRKQLKTPTLFNIVGPLTNPTKPPLALIGVYKKSLLIPMVKALNILGYKRAMVVHCGGMDEVGLHADTQVSELNNGTINNYTLTPTNFGLDYQPISALCYSSKEEAYTNMLNLLKGKGKPIHEFVISANVALLLKLFGYEDLKKNVLTAMNKIRHGSLYNFLLSLSETERNYDRNNT